MENLQAQQIDGNQGSNLGELGEPEEMPMAIAEH